MTGSKVRVVVRARPTGKTDSENYKFDEAGSSVKIKSHNGGMEHFPVDQLIVNGTQEKVFDSCTEDIIRACLEGYNGAILAYGQTGAGKTFTIAGGRSFLQRGIIPRTIGRIYQEVAARPENLITIRLSYVEIYNELMFDLLHRTPVKDQKGDLLVQEDAKGNVFVKGLSLLQAATEEQALNVYFQGDNQKAISEHTLNEASSRSHTVFTIYVESRSRVESSEKITSSKIHLVDLAGSERLKKTNSEGSTLKEAAYINKSLSYLEQVVVALANKQRDHVPYRQSRLTHFLKDSLGGNSKTTLIANIFPETRFVEETGSTLRFATRMMKVVNRPNVNIHLDNDLLLKKYERDIKDLRQELSMHDTLAGRGRVQYSDYTPDEVRALETKVTQYVEGESEHMEIVSLKMVHESFSIMRKMIHALQKDLRERRVIGGTNNAGTNNAGTNNAGTNNATDGILSSETGEPPQAEEGDVGIDDDATGGFGVGVAGGSNKPKTQENDVDGGIPGDEEISTPRKKSPKKKLQEIHVPDKQTSFKDWKERQGQSYEVKFQNLKQQLQNKRLKCKQIIQTLNQKKQTIDNFMKKINMRLQERAAQGFDDVLDEEEYQLRSEHQRERTEYRHFLEEKRELDASITQLESEVKQCKTELVTAFDRYYLQKYGDAIAKQSPNLNIAESIMGGNITMAPGMDTAEIFSGLESQRYEGDMEAYTYYKAKKSASMTGRKR